MKFRKIKYLNVQTQQEDVALNKRLEYFHHFWSFLLDKKNTLSLFKEERLESHRSLLSKIELQLEENRIRYPKRILALFVNHPYFGDNLIAKESRAGVERIKQLRAFIRNNLVKNNKPIYDEKSKHLPHVRKQVKKISTLILGKTETRYVDRILQNLIKSLHGFRPFSEKQKKDLKFLINATIVELYHYGYSVEYLKKLPDIILFPKSHPDDFPYSKTYVDFNTIEEYKAFKVKEFNELTLRRQLASLVHLIRRPKQKGYYVFKINNFDFQEKPMKIQGVTFYNPGLGLSLNYKNLSDELKAYVEDMERYFEQYVRDVDKEKYRSSCNAIIQVLYRPLHWNKPDNSIYAAVSQVERSLRTMIRFKYYYIGGHSEHAVVSKDTYILANADLEYRNAPLFHDGSYFDPPFKMPEEKNRLLAANLTWVHSLTPTNDLHRKVIDIFDSFNKYLNRPVVFSFKDFWIEVCAPLFPNDIPGFLTFAKRCVRHYLKRKFAVNVKIQLSDALKLQAFQQHSNYFLSDADWKKLGLEIKYLSPIYANSFLRNYHKISAYNDIPILDEILFEVDRFVKHNSLFMDDVDSWVEKTILESYAERNLEVHNNIRTDLSMLKLRDTSIQIIHIILIVLSEKVKRGVKNIDQLEI